MLKVTVYTKSGAKCEVDDSESRSELSNRIYRGLRKRKYSLTLSGESSSTIIPFESIDFISIKEVSK